MESRTNRTAIRSALRRLFLRSRERGAALKRDGYTCQRCFVKACNRKDKLVKVEVHHKRGVHVWDETIRLIQKDLLCDPNELETLCKECHQKENN